tara:strand:+ start:541 stop:1134 length:594 start_codon:yes stop_codon:yes gene_type:complete
MARVGATGLSEFRTGQQLENAGNLHEAAIHYGRAIHMYLPLSPLPARAAERLLSLAQTAEARGQRDEARFCYEELRSGFLAVRSFYQPGSSYIDTAQLALTELMLSDPRGSWPDRSLPAAERQAVITAALDKREDPNRFWVLVMGIGYLIWLGAAAAAIWRGLPSDSKQPIAWKSLTQMGAISLTGYLCWLLGVALA